MKGNRPRAVPANPRTRAIRAQQHQLAVGTGHRAPRPHRRAVPAGPPRLPGLPGPSAWSGAA